MQNNYRDYALANNAVRDNYRKIRTLQNVDTVQRLHQKYDAPDTTLTPFPVWKLMDSLNHFVDLSDPDLELPNIVHLYQTAEGIRKAGHPEWMQVVGLIHDLGKCIYLRGCDTDGTSMKEQWAIVGDTFVLGEPLPETLVYPEFNQLHQYQDLNYPDGCGLDQCLVSYGHDEYLYQLLQRQRHQIPEEGLYMIRYHSLYPWHRDGCYRRLESDRDRTMKPRVQLFNQFDLYTKENRKYTDEELRELHIYYDGLLRQYLPSELEL